MGRQMRRKLRASVCDLPAAGHRLSHLMSLTPEELGISLPVRHEGTKVQHGKNVQLAQLQDQIFILVCTAKFLLHGELYIS